jgi:lipopolysaccharide/colanic/teichoic acid biosynthesis glycosyltransferase
MGVIEAILVGVLATLLAAEGLDWLPRFTEFLIRTAARSLPEKSRDRYYEEWLAEAGHVPGKISRLIYALDLIRASFVMRNPRPMKRIFDIAIASMLMMIMAPLLAFIALLVALETGRPILYRHSRIGQGGRRFNYLKFRTTVPNPDAVLARHLAEHPEAREQWLRDRKLKHDPRITLLGAWLRRTALDELPQLINVVRGDMSLVGPRPVIEDELPRYGANLVYYMEGRPGMTGLWQVSGRKSVDYRRRVRLDSWYVKNWSLCCDLVILMRTALAGFLGQRVEKGPIRPFRRWRRFWRSRIRRLWR